jgi:hypothetical protein
LSKVSAIAQTYTFYGKQSTGAAHWSWPWYLLHFTPWYLIYQGETGKLMIKFRKLHLKWKGFFTLSAIKCVCSSFIGRPTNQSLFEWLLH